METKYNLLDATSLPKETYEAPFIEIFEAKVELGFYSSLNNPNDEGDDSSW